VLLSPWQIHVALAHSLAHRVQSPANALFQDGLQNR
jgi:hypothetical protein